MSESVMPPPFVGIGQPGSTDKDRNHAFLGLGSFSDNLPDEWYDRRYCRGVSPLFKVGYSADSCTARNSKRMEISMSGKKRQRLSVDSTPSDHQGVNANATSTPRLTRACGAAFRLPFRHTLLIRVRR